MKKIADGAAYFFIVAVFVLTVISLFGVWGSLSHDVITKSFESIGLLAFVSIIILVAERFVDGKKVATTPEETALRLQSVSNFILLRKMTIAVLIAGVVSLAFVGLLSIWEVLLADVITKSLTSISLVVFSSIVITIVCLEREDGKLNINPVFFIILVPILWIFSLFFHFLF